MNTIIMKNKMNRTIKNLIIALISVSVLSLIIIVLVSMVMHDKIENQNAELGKYKQKLSNSLDIYNNVSHNRDSLKAVNILLSKYRGLTDAMYYRDSIRKPMRFTIGDIAHLKRDSSRVVVKDIIVGGGKFEYYIKYQILYKDNSTETVSPELIY